jgi:hypothetical protein
MRNSRSCFNVLRDEEGEAQIDTSFMLTREDWEIFEKTFVWFKAKTGQDLDEGDYLLALVTMGLHQLEEDRTGKPFVLRMDRPKN